MYKSKYRSSKVINEYGKFDSKKEFNRYLQLKEKEEKREIQNLKRQVEYILIERQTNENGKFLFHPIKYIADFVYTDNTTGKEIVEDVKGIKTEIYKIKKKLLYYVHKIKINEV